MVPRVTPSAMSMVPTTRMNRSKFVAAPRGERALVRWGHSPGKTACVSTRRGSAYWGHLSAKSLAISTNGSIRLIRAPGGLGFNVPAGVFRLPPEVLEPVGGQLGVAHRVLDVFVAEPR